MRNTRFLVGLAVLATAMPLAAQTVPSDDPAAPRTPLPYDRGYDKDDPRTDAINAAERSEVVAANRAVLAEDASTTAAVSSQYQQDMVAYRAAMRAHRRAVADTDAEAARRERAYADAMADWRRQVRACDRGNRRVCELPAPNPADYM